MCVIPFISQKSTNNHTFLFTTEQRVVLFIHLLLQLKTEMKRNCRVLAILTELSIQEQCLYSVLTSDLKENDHSMAWTIVVCKTQNNFFKLMSWLASETRQNKEKLELELNVYMIKKLINYFRPWLAGWLLSCWDYRIHPTLISTSWNVFFFHISKKKMTNFFHFHWKTMGVQTEPWSLTFFFKPFNFSQLSQNTLRLNKSFHSHWIIMVLFFPISKQILSFSGYVLKK